jgi:carboxymethylenebutenolidase
MGDTAKITGADGFEFAAYYEPAFTPRKGGVIVLQEIFGVDENIRGDVTAWAKDGFDAIAPALFERRQRDFHAKHDPEGVQAGLAHALATPLEQALSDIAACMGFLARHHDEKLCVVGYCYGGSLAWLSACHLAGFAAAASYYGSLVQRNAHLEPRCPTIVHLGGDDPGIPAAAVEQEIHRHHPDLPVYVYDGAGHGFANGGTDRYSAQAADLARHRTVGLFERS